MTTMNGTTAHEAILQHLIADPQRLCFSLRAAGQWRDVSRSEFHSHVLGWSSVFRSQLAPGSLILFLKRPDLHLLSAYVGAMHAGMLPAQMSYDRSRLRADEFNKKIQHALAVTSANAVFHDVEESTAGHLPPGIKTFCANDFKVADEHREVLSTPLALVQFSSGSTGLQKGVVLSHKALLNQVRHYAEVLKLAPNDKLVSWLPLYHDMGLIACFLMPLIAGVPFYQIDPFEWIVQPDILLEAIETFRGTLCFLPNFAYHVLAKKGKARDLSSMRYFVNCSEPAKHKTHEEFLARFSSVKPEALVVCYAMAENTFAVTQSTGVTSAFVTPAEPGMSCGKPIPGTTLRIFEPNDKGEGEIGIAGDCLFEHFTDGHLPLTEGFYLTGDLGYLRADGSLVVTGRKKDIVIVNGKNLYPQDVEFACSSVPGVYPGRAAAFGIFDEQIGSEGLYVLAETDGTVTVQQLKVSIQKAISDELGVVPRRVEIFSHMELAKTSSGKISRSLNRDLFLSGKLRSL